MTLIVFLLMILIGGANAPLVKFATNQFPPGLFVLLRSILAVLFIFPAIYYYKSLTKIRISRNLILANFLFAGNWLFFAFGIQYTSVIVAAVIYVPTALIVAAIGYLFLKEKLSKEQILGLALTIIGMLMLLYGSMKTQDIFSFGKPFGNLLVILGLISWSLYVVVSRKISRIYTPLSITFFNFLITTLIAILFIPVEFSRGVFSFSHININSVFALVYLALFSSLIFFYLYQWLIKHTSAFTSSLVLYPTTIFASFLGVIFFKERLTSGLLISSIFILVGLFFATSYQFVVKYFKL